MWPTFLILVIVAAVAIHLYWRRRYLRSVSHADKLERELAEVRSKFERTLAESSAQLSAVFDSMAEGVLVLGEDRRIEFANPALIELFGLTADLKGRPLIEVLRVHELDELTRGLEAGDQSVERQLQINGSLAQVFQVTASAIRGPHQRLQGVVLVFHDLTRLKQLENLRQDFVANVSHELRTPLSVIKGYVETLLNLPEDQEGFRTKFLKTIEKHTDRLVFLIEDLLTLSKLESGGLAMNLQTIRARAFVSSVIEDLRRNIGGKQTAIENEVPEELVVDADPERLQQVFCNLIENAVKYGKPNGRVRVGGKASKDGLIVELWVADDGPGIPAEAQARVFERFYRVDRARSSETGGTGLGLSIVKHIVQLHRGKVWLESRVGEGSTFFFSLPASPKL